MTSTRDPFERLISLRTPGLYESNYLKANSPDGQRALWIKHNLLRPGRGTSPGLGEFWAIAFERGEPPIVAKQEVQWEDVTLSETEIGVRVAGISLTPTETKGTIADLSWDMRLTSTQPPLLHLRWDWMYTAGFPKKKVVTPAPNLRFDGTFMVGAERWTIDGWIGMRGHNWGREHAWRYAYGNCNLWDDGHPRLVDGFSARIKLGGGMKSPWLSTIMGRAPDHALNNLNHWFGGATVSPEHWALRTGGCQLEMRADTSTYVGLRYAHPGGDESYCYNTKFASVDWRTPSGRFTSQTGELEVLYDQPLADIPLHPSVDWDASAGDYRSES